MQHRGVDLRVLLPALAIATMALAGCATDTPQGAHGVDATNAMPLPPGATGASIPLLYSPSVLAGPGGDAESSIAVSHDGKTVLACSHGGFTQPSPLWASVDGGATFKRYEPAPNQPFDGDCDVAITDDGAWHIVYDTVASATFASSTDQGKTWWIHPFTAEPFGGVDRPWILAVGNDVYLAWGDVEAALPFMGFFTKTSDHGKTWSPHTLMGSFSPAEVTCFMGHPIVAPGGAVQAPVVCHGGEGGDGTGAVSVLESTDGGLLWQKIRTSVRSAGSITASYAGDGGLWMTVSKPDGKGNDHGVVHSTDKGRTWTDPLWLAGNVTPGFGWFWIDGRPDGSATAAWMDTTPASDPKEPSWQVRVARVSYSGETHLDAMGFVGPVGTEAPLYEFFMVRHDDAGRAYMSFPQITGPDCHKGGTLPSQVGSGNVPRNAQCVYVVVEPVA